MIEHIIVMNKITFCVCEKWST